jgi:hypothetical protein
MLVVLCACVLAIYHPWSTRNSSPLHVAPLTVGGGHHAHQIIHGPSLSARKPASLSACGWKRLREVSFSIWHLIQLSIDVLYKEESALITYLFKWRKSLLFVGAINSVRANNYILHPVRLAVLSAGVHYCFYIRV